MDKALHTCYHQKDSFLPMALAENVLDIFLVDSLFALFELAPLKNLSA